MSSKTKAKPSMADIEAKNAVFNEEHATRTMLVHIAGELSALFGDLATHVRDTPNYVIPGANTYSDAVSRLTSFASRLETLRRHPILNDGADAGAPPCVCFLPVVGEACGTVKQHSHPDALAPLRSIVDGREARLAKERTAWAVALLADRLAHGALISGDESASDLMTSISSLASAELHKQPFDFDGLLALAMERIKTFTSVEADPAKLLAPLDTTAKPKPATTTTETTMLVDAFLIAGVEAVDPIAVMGLHGDELDRAIGAAVARWPEIIGAWSDEERRSAEAWTDAVLSSGNSPEVISAAPKHLLALPVGEQAAPAIGATVRRNFGETSVDGRVVDIPAPCRILVEVIAAGDGAKRELLDQHASQWRVVYSV